MRLSPVKNARGGVAVLVVLSVTLLTAMLLLIVDVGRLAVASARLQAAADRAAYAGAASLASSLDRIASANWELNKAFRDLEGDLLPNSQQDDDAVQESIQRYEGARDAALAEIEEVRSAMPDRARAAAASALTANAPASSADIVVRGDARLDADADPDDQWRTLSYDVVTGNSFIDPESTAGGTYDALRYLQKQASPDASVGVFAVSEVQPLFLTAALGDAMEVRASAAAQAFGGAVDAFALKETDTAGDAEAQVDDDGFDALYRASLTPMWTVGDGGDDLFN